ncbi:Translin-1 [Friedmanniomyces endolithicus]|nr:Translin-1 [Friedmanniomyces endolithicus]
MATSGDGMIESGIFESLQRKIDDDSAVKDLASDTEFAVPSVVSSAQASIDKEVQTIHKLSETASKEPYYKFNYAWTRQIQDVCSSILLCGWLGGFGKGEAGQLLTIEDVGGVMGVPVNLKDRDAFHLTIEEYLQALISLLDELARLARNSVTLGDYRRPQLIAQFIKEVHAGFQILNLKNDTLRKRSDGIKYRVKEVEDVVYDLRAGSSYEGMYANLSHSGQLAWTAAEGVVGNSSRRPLEGGFEDFEGDPGGKIEAQQSKLDGVEHVMSHAVRKG